MAVIEFPSVIANDERRLIAQGLTPEQAARAARAARLYRAAKHLYRQTAELRRMGDTFTVTAAYIAATMKIVTSALDDGFAERGYYRDCYAGGEDQLEQALTRAELALEDLREKAAADTDKVARYGNQLGACLCDLFPDP